MKIHIRLSSIILLSLFTLSAQGQTEDAAFLAALEKHPAAKIIWEANGKNNGFDVFFNVSDPTCNGGNDGSICAVPDTPGIYNYFWFDNNSNGICITGIDAGNYLLQVTNTGTSEICLFNVDVSEPPSIGVFAMNAIPGTCAGECDGAANPFAGGGTGTLSYLYDSGENTQAASMLCNPFTLTVTDQNGCFIDTTFTYTNAPDSISISAITTDISCDGLMDGAIDATTTGGTGTLDFAWEFNSAPYAATEDISSLDPGDYSLTVIDDNGCTADSTFSIADAVPIEVSAVLTDIVCYGDSTGAIVLDVIGGDSTYTVDWTGPAGFTSILEDIDELIAGTYNLTITDGLNCDKDTFFILNQNLPIDIAAIITPVDCHDSLTGAIDVTVTGPFAILDYSWTGDISTITEDISNLAAGTYILAVADDQGCMVDSTFVLDNPEEILLSFDITDIQCAGESTGSIDLEATGGTGNLTFLWTPLNVNTEDIDNLAADDYTIVVEDENGCTATSTITINEPLPITVVETITPVSCNGEGDGSITVVVTGGTGDPTLVWTPIEPIDAPAGTYTLTVTDENDCEEIFVYEITAPDAIDVDITVTDVSCNGLNDGSIEVVASGGTGPLDLLWTPAINPASVPAGDYLLTITDVNDCSLDTLITVGEPNAIDLSVDITHVLCAGESNGAIDLTATGGTGTLTYAWSPGNEETEDISGLSGDTYTVVVTDQMLCTEEITAIVDEPDPIVVDATINHIDCSGEDDGFIDVIISGGNEAYTLSWFPVEPTDVGAGIYTLTVTDANMCEVVIDYEILDANPILIDVSVTDVTCNGLSDGTITASASGGVGVLTLEWTPPINPSAVAAGDYLLEVTDASDCVKDTVITIDEPPVIFINIDVTDVDCFGDDDGAIVITPVGGTGAGTYTYVWTGPPGPYNLNDKDISGLSAGTYTVVVTDLNDCTGTVSGEVDEPLSIVVAAVVADIDCDGDDTGSIITTVSNGSGPYTYLWSGPSITGANVSDEDVFNLLAGIYTLTVTDNNLCSVDTLFEVMASNPILVTETITDVLCNGDSTGAIVLEVTGGTGTLVYAWTNGMGITGSGQNLTNLPAGIYTVTITDDLDCAVVLDFTVDEAAPIILSAIAIDPLCFGEETGSIDATATGDFPDFIHTWMGPPGFTPVSGIALDLTDLADGTYILTVTDAVGCTAVNSYTLTEPTDLVATLQLTDPICGQVNGMAEATVIGGTVATDYTYVWLDENLNLLSSNGPVQGSLDAGSYFFAVTDDNGCSVLIPFELSDEVGNIAATITDVTCFETCNGAIDVEITGMNGSLDIGWTGPNGPYVTEDLTSLCAGDYTITVEDDLGCELVETYSVDSPNEIVLNAIIIDESCPGANDGAIDLTVMGGTGMKTYLWNGPGVINIATQDLNNLAPGIYTVQVTDANSCVTTESFTVNPAIDYSITAVLTEITCAGAGDGAIDVTVTPALAGATYVWNGPGGPYNSEDIFGLAPGNYILQITTAQFCVLNASYTITATAPIAAVATVTNSACGMSTGAVDFTITGGTVVGNYGIEVYMLPADTPVGTTGLDGGSYIYTITDDNGCAFMGSFTISDELGTLDESITGVTCQGGSDGAIDITIDGLTGDLDIQWVFNGLPYSTDEDIEMLDPGSYTVTITDENGCVLGETYEVPDAVGVTITATIEHLDCFGDGDGAIDISYSGVLGNPDFEWTYLSNPISQSEDISDLDGGVYTVVVIGEAGCQGTSSFTVNEPAILTVAASITPVLCNGDDTGAINIVISGGTGPYFPVWTWSNGGSNFANINGLEAGIYTLNLTDSHGCTFTMDYVVPEATPITIDTLQLVNANCSMADGLIEVIAMGGNSPYSYTWTNSLNQEISSLPLADNLVAGMYTVEVVDEDLCSVTFDFVISNTNATLSAALTHPTCGLGDNGAIDLTVSGETTSPVTFNWIGPDETYDTEDISGLEAGTYTVTVQDGAGCLYQASYVLNEPQIIDLAEVITDVTCSGDMDGAINITPNIPGGIDYLWNGPPPIINVPTQDISGLQGGFYELVINTDEGCTATFTYEVLEPEVLDATALVTHVSCNGGSDGAIDLTITGGTTAYDVLWIGPDGPFAFSQDINGLDPGIYTVSIIDAHGCTYDEQFEVLEAQAIMIDVIDQGAASCNAAVGYIEVAGIGGNGGFTYIWTNSAGDTVSQVALAEMLFADTYTIEVTDASGCTQEEEYIISNEDLILTAAVTDVTCFGLDNGSIDLSIQGNLQLTDTTWTGPDDFIAFTEDISNLIAGEYFVELEDAFGCTFLASYLVTQPTQIVADTTSVGLDCFGDADGSISILNITGGSGVYATEWEDEEGPISGGLEITGLEAGTYTLTVSDNVPCAVEYEFIITAPNAILVDENLQDPTCLGLEDGAITLNVDGGQGVLIYAWTGGTTSNQEDLINLGQGTYDLLITDDSLCTFTESYLLVGSQAIDLDLTIDSVACNGDENGLINAPANSITGGIIHVWTVGGSFYSNDVEITDLAPDTYVLQITDDLGCVLDTAIVLSDPELISVELQTLISVTCNGDADGAIDITPAGGTGILSTEWSGAITSNDEDINGLDGGTYMLTVTDDNDCVTTEEYTIIEPEVLQVSLVSTQDAECQNTADGIIETSVDGGTPEYSFSWQGQGDLPDEQNLIGVLPGEYILTVTDDHGCTTEGLYTVDYMIEVSVDAGEYAAVCNGTELTLQGSGSPSTSDFAWFVPGSTVPFSIEQSITIVPSSTNNTFIYSITNGNCVAMDTTTIGILQLPTPDAGEDLEVFLEETITLGGDPWPTASSFSWIPGGELMDANDANPSWLVSGSETFILTVIDFNGCLGSDQVTITINPTVDVPGGFTPNNDGTNDTWEILNTQQFPDMVVQIFNRWGDELWQSRAGYTTQWDGTYQGKEIPVGTYYFIIELNDDRFPKPITGPVTIFR